MLADVLLASGDTAWAGQPSRTARESSNFDESCETCFETFLQPVAENYPRLTPRALYFNLRTRSCRELLRAR